VPTPEGLGLPLEGLPLLVTFTKQAGEFGAALLQMF
jgi:hypothetical protein